MVIPVGQREERQLRRPIIKMGLVVTASAVVAAGASTLFSQSSNVVALPFVHTAAINPSNTTVGFADSDLYGMSRADIDRTLDEMQAMGVNNVRVLIPWAGIELVDDFYYWNTIDYVVDAADARGMGILGVVNSTPAWATEPGAPAVAGPPASPEEYAEFVGAVADRYEGRIGAYEVWNEPNAYTFWYPAPDPEAYTELLQAAYPAIKAADPDAVVIGGVVGWVSDYGDLAISPARYVDAMYDAGAQGYFDALSYHPYHYTLPFSQGGRYPAISPQDQLELMRDAMVANGDEDKLIWASEYGQPTSQGGELKQAAYLQDFLTTWSSYEYTGPSFIYTTRDRNTGSTDPQDTFGVLRTDWSAKPAAEVIRLWTATHPQTAPDPVTLTATTTDVADADEESLSVAPMTATEVPESTVATTTSTASTATKTVQDAVVEAVEDAVEAAPELAPMAEAVSAATDTTDATDETDTAASDDTVEPTDTTESTDTTDESDSTDSTDSSDSTGVTGSTSRTGTSGSTDDSSSTTGSSGSTGSSSTGSSGSTSSSSTGSSDSDSSDSAA